MKNILFSTTHFNTVENGPSFFANLLFEKTNTSNEIDLRILTEDVNNDSKKIYKLKLQKNKFNRFFYQLFRIRKYHSKSVAIKKRFKFDILVYNNAFTGVLSTVSNLRKVVVMINDYNRIDFITSKFEFSKKYFKNLLLFKLEKTAAINANTVVVNSIFLSDTIHKLYGIPKIKIKVLYKGIDIGKYQFRLRDKFPPKINILFVKGGYENGGFYELIDAISSLRNNSFKITIIGPKEIDIPLLEKYIKEKGIESFELFGPTKPELLKKYFNKADIFCVPSHKEALGVANMEALACGIPVISTNVGGIPEVLDYGKCGWLVEAKNSIQLAEAINECINNPRKRVEKSKYGYNYVQKFNSENLINNFIDIIDVL